MNDGDVWVFESRGGSRFLLEALPRLRIRYQIVREYFDSNLAAELDVARAIDDAHTSLTELL